MMIIGLTNSGVAAGGKGGGLVGGLDVLGRVGVGCHLRYLICLGAGYVFLVV